MRYRNTITGEVIEINSKITEGPWQVLEPANPLKKEDEPVQQKKRKVVKKDE